MMSVIATQFLRENSVGMTDIIANEFIRWFSYSQLKLKFRTAADRP